MVELYDLSVADMLTAITDFSKSSGGCSLAALAIMSHGDKAGNICGNDEMSKCSVQEVVDAMCQLELQSTTKVLLTISIWKLVFLKTFLPWPSQTRTSTRSLC